jgi:predicted nucleic acid-binding Zn ribbon protein
MDNLIKTLPAILAAAGASEEVVEAACIAAWKHIVGEGLGSHAVPVQLQNQKLVVLVEDNIWQRQLEQMRGQLLFRLNSLLGQTLVESIELRIDPKSLTKARGSREGLKKERPDYEVPGELLTAAAGIEDVELRRAFLGAATSCIRRVENKSEIQKI